LESTECLSGEGLECPNSGLDIRLMMTPDEIEGHGDGHTRVCQTFVPTAVPHVQR
jgi:hypothetical protein